MTSLPLLRGFGLRTGVALRRLRGLVDISIVGTALLAVWEQGGATEYEVLLRELRTGT